MLNFKFSRNLLGPRRRNVRNRNEAGGGNQTPKVFRVALAHPAYSQYPDPQLSHAGFLSESRDLAGYVSTKKIAVQTLLATSRFTGRHLTPAAARSIFRASCPQHE